MFTFIVENRVENGNANDAFEYTIGVSEELVVGKMGTSTTNSAGVPDRRWGSVNATLKNNETVTVVVKVSYISNWGGANSVEIDVVDKDGVVVKTGHVIYCNNNTYKNFVSDYKYTLSITQGEKAGYETTVGTEDPIGTIVTTTDDISRSFTFKSCESRLAAFSSSFTPEENAYVGGESSGLKVVFTNTTALQIGPTGVMMADRPFGWLALAGMALMMGAVLPGKRRRREEP